MNGALKLGFPPFVNEQSLRSAIVWVCADFGRVKRLRILPAGRTPNLSCACFLQLDSAPAKIELMSKLQVSEFADDLHFLADVDERWTGATM